MKEEFKKGRDKLKAKVCVSSLIRIITVTYDPLRTRDVILCSVHNGLCLWDSVCVGVHLCALL